MIHKGNDKFVCPQCKCESIYFIEDFCLTQSGDEIFEEDKSGFDCEYCGLHFKVIPIGDYKFELLTSKI